ncbi:unnamed protein product [Pieris brassicae]|uniref:Uncharacterized protein n=1 Tax=Pieris brassicae TaxID=7116 RepID=A0A9P0SLB5_PIEBR|nr:unnamed protein product [Pieris brassicae]
MIDCIIKEDIFYQMREGAARNDAERERRARGDWEARARAAEADVARLAGKLHAAQREIVRLVHEHIIDTTSERTDRDRKTKKYARW